MKYQCGIFIYDLPETSCVFCQNADVFWDYTNGIYLVLCPNKSIDNTIWIKGCDKRKAFPEGTSFVSKEYNMRNVLMKEDNND